MTWREQAACLGRGNLWDAALDDTERETPRERERRHTYAKNICGRCPVQLPCIEAVNPALDEGIRAGILLHNAHGDRLAPIPHGTDAGYAAHFRRGIPITAADPCGCRAAHQRARIEREGKRTA